MVFAHALEGFQRVMRVMFRRPVEVGEACIGGLEKNEHYDTTRNLMQGERTVGKTAVVYMKNRDTKAKQNTSTFRYHSTDITGICEGEYIRQSNGLGITEKPETLYAFGVCDFRFGLSNA